ncbi:erythromycin esterase family protein [Nonomuraea longicatena]|uniref:Erythromycin esterase family protein n=1 Tax=Nonomuraea longicatena TaxID=83682 RepID=A0ABP3ZD25_9ACTN
MSKNSLRRGLPVAVAQIAALTAALTAGLSAAPALADPATRPADGARSVVATLEKHARPLRSTVPGGSARDLRALAALTRGASIVGVGEATHGSKELFTVRERLFRYLVAEEGFTTLALEATWSAGVRLDAYVRTGEGDLRTIIDEEFQESYSAWRTQEWVDLYEWMREYNRTAERELRVMGFDIGDVNPEQYRRVLDWAERKRPDLLAGLRENYAGLLALPGGTAERMAALGSLPLERRKELASAAETAYRLVEQAKQAGARVKQEARVIAQMAGMYAREGAELHRHRDLAMAENTMWWKRNTGLKSVAAAHNGHLGYVSAWPHQYPVTQGAHLRAMAGREYVAVATSIHSGEFLAKNPAKNGKVEVFDTGAPKPDSNEATLDRVGHRDFYVDLRRAGKDPATRKWLAEARPTWTIPATYMPQEFDRPLSLGRAYDIMLHLNRVTAATPLS